MSFVDLVNGERAWRDALERGEGSLALVDAFGACFPHMARLA